MFGIHEINVIEEADFLCDETFSDQAYEMGQSCRCTGEPVLNNPFNPRYEEDEHKAFVKGYMDEENALRRGH